MGAAQFSSSVADFLGLFEEGLDREAYLAEGIDLALTAWQSPPVTVAAQAESLVVAPEDVVPSGIGPIVAGNVSHVCHVPDAGRRGRLCL